MVEDAVKSLRAGAEVSAIDRVVLVRIEPVGGPKHGEEEHDRWLHTYRGPQTHHLRLPARILFQNHLGSVASDDVLPVTDK